MNKKWKFEPDPITKGYIDYLDKSPIKFDNLKRNIELLKRMNEKINEKTFIELCKEADAIKCYGQPAFS